LQFTHEITVTVDGPAHSVLADWSDVTCLPQILTHVRATARADAPDLGRIIIMLDGSHIEFAAQRTMCDSETICWQNLGNEFEYVLTMSVHAEGHGSRITVNCCYDPPGFLTDVIERFGFSTSFEDQLGSDLKRYAETFHRFPHGHLASIPGGGAPGRALRAIGITD
jgi:uncharacterized membrane protein